MKINRWIAPATIALLVVGAMAAVVYTTYAQDSTTDGDEVSELYDHNAALQGQADITREEAEAIALAQYPGASVVATELENEGGKLLYSIELDNGAEVEVDAKDGTPLPAEAETDSEGSD